MVAPSLLVSSFIACEGKANLSQSQANTTSRSCNSNVSNSHEDHFILSASPLGRVGFDPVRLCEDSTAWGRMNGRPTRKSGRPLQRSKWVVAYDTSRACLPGGAGQIVATVKPSGGQKPPHIKGANVVFRVTNKSSWAKVYEKSARILPSGQASLPMLLANTPFALEGGRAPSFACSIQVGTAAAQPVACPALSKCKLPVPTLRPSAAPTPNHRPEPTVSPSHYDSSEPTVSPSYYDSPEPAVSLSHYDSPEPAVLPSQYDSPEPTASPSAVSTPEGTVNKIYDITLGPGIRPHFRTAVVP
jgi:hypothetical protein